MLTLVFSTTIWNAIGGCFTAVVSLLATVAIVGYIVARVNVQRFKNRYRGRCLLVVGSRHGWYDFVRNNIAPALPTKTELVWTTRSNVSLLSALSSLRISGAKPLLVYVGPSKKLAHMSLHAQLLPFKHFAARNKDVQQQVSAIIDAATTLLKATAA